MSPSELTSAVERLREAAIDAAWRQWDAIFTFVKTDRPAQGIVDPEALLVFSLWGRVHEPRVWSSAYVWGNVAPRLLSVQRTKNILREFPVDLSDSVQEFAVGAVERGGDARWRSLIAGTDLDAAPHRTESASPQLTSQASVMLRLRLALGIGIKADVLAYLIGCVGVGATIQQITDATFYYGRAVRRAVEELAAGGFVQPRATAPASYAADLGAWARLLDFNIDNPPAWRSWVNIYAFVAAVSEWATTVRESTAVVAASEARDLLAQYGHRVDALQAWIPTPGKYPGEEFLNHFNDKILGTLSDYVGSVV